jgi:hypothetical protein
MNDCIRNIIINSDNTFLLLYVFEHNRRYKNLLYHLRDEYFKLQCECEKSREFLVGSYQKKFFLHQTN